MWDGEVFRVNSASIIEQDVEINVSRSLVNYLDSAQPVFNVLQDCQELRRAQLCTDLCRSSTFRCQNAVMPNAHLTNAVDEGILVFHIHCFRLV
jgi:hypothetical protein